MRQILVVCLVVISLGVWVPRARACFCLVPELSDSYKAARSVFLGQTIRIDKPKTLDQSATITDRAFTVRFKIIRSWKGVPYATSEFNILWLTDCYECIPLPNMNDNYLVFGDPLSDSKTWSLIAMCNRTVVVPSDSALTNPDISPKWDIKQLDIITKRPPRNRRAYNKSLHRSGGKASMKAEG